MPRCVSTGCDQTAFYGLVYNQPRFCKAHADGSGSVKKKCAWSDCSNAISHGDICSRCNAVQVTIQSFKEMQLDELDTLITKENTDRLRIGLANVQPTSQAVAHVARRAPKPDTLAVRPSASPAVVPTALPKTKTAKIVRTPEEPKHVADPASMKKRAQTPGRARGVGETKI